MFDDNGSFLLALFEFFLFFAWFMRLFWVLGDIFRSKDLGGGAKTLWVIFVIIIPWLGSWPISSLVGTACTNVSSSRQGSRRPRRPTSSPSPHRVGRRRQPDRRRQGALDSGAITQAEFDQLKAKALAS